MQSVPGKSSFLSRYSSATVESFIREHGDDVASDGVFIETDRPLAVGTLLTFEVRLKTEEVVLSGRGRVRWRREPKQATRICPPGMGLSFLKLDDRSRDLVARIAAEHPKAGVRFTAAPENDRRRPVSDRFAIAPGRAATAPPAGAIAEREIDLALSKIEPDERTDEVEVPSLLDDELDGKPDSTVVMPSSRMLQAAPPAAPPSSQHLVAAAPTSSPYISVGAPDSRRELPLTMPSGATLADAPKGSVVITTLLAVIAGALLLIVIVLVIGGAYLARSIKGPAGAPSTSAVASTPIPRATESAVTPTSSAPEAPPPPNVASSAPPASARTPATVAASAPKPRPAPAPVRRPAPPPRAPAVPAWATD